MKQEQESVSKDGSKQVSFTYALFDGNTPVACPKLNASSSVTMNQHKEMEAIPKDNLAVASDINGNEFMFGTISVGTTGG